MPKSRELPREPINIDKLGRITIPKRFRDALGLPEGQKYPLWIEADPDLENCRGLVLRR